MRKILAVFLTLIVILTMSVSVFAEPGAFVESPSANGAPVLMEEYSDDGVKITAYRNRAVELNASQVADFEKAYKSIVGAADLTTLVAAVSDVAEEFQVEIDELAVSDLFYVSLKGGEESFNGIRYKLRLRADTFANFVCILRMENGEWHLVEETEVIGTEVIEFVADEVGSYAVVVSVGDAPVYPGAPDDDRTGNVWVTIGIILAILATLAIIFFIILLLFKAKRDKEEDEEQNGENGQNG